MAWIGKKKIAFIPVYRPRLDFVPPDWAEQIERRIYFNPDGTHLDASLRNYIYTTSYGRADLEGVILPIVAIDGFEIKVQALSDRGDSLRSQGFDAAALVTQMGVNNGSAETGTGAFFARFAMAEQVGVWAMELTHTLTGYSDLYVVQDNLGSYDNMACACGTHPSAFTKVDLGWLDPSAITQHLGRFGTYDLHSVGLVQPAPEGRTTAVQVGKDADFFVVEARQSVDQFDRNTVGDGVIVYQVENPNSHPHPDDGLIMPLIHLKTPKALTPGTAYTSGTGLQVQVISALPGGFSIKVDDTSQPLVFEPGELLFYRDFARDGTGDVDFPSLIGRAGWETMKFVLSAGAGIIYAVDQQGRLVFYRDFNRDGTGDVNTPSVIGQGGWQSMRHVFAGDPGVLYAVDEQGRLLFYHDETRDGTGDVNTPSVIGQGGWEVFSQVCYGGDGIIYAVVAAPI